MIAAGLALLGFVALIRLNAELYQAEAKRSLASEISSPKQLKIGPPKRIVRIGDLLGRVDIPKLGLSVAVVEGTNPRMLRLGAGHIEGTSLLGEAGNIGIAGHRDTFFRALQDIRENDEIQLVTASGLTHYRVDWLKIVAPEDVSVLAPSNESVLTLVTCYPFQFLGSAPKRFAVRAHKY